MPVQDIVLARTWKGLNLATAPHLLTEGESPESLDAALFNRQEGILGKRKNRRRIFTDTSGNSASVYNFMGVIPFNILGTRGRVLVRTSHGFGSPTTPSIMPHDYNWVSLGGAYDNFTQDATVEDAGTSVRARGVQYGNNVYLFNGRNRMARMSGVAATSTNCNKAGIDRVVFTPTAVTGAAGLLTGRYYYYVVPVNSKKTDPFGRPARGIPSAVSLVVSPVLQRVTVGNIPNHTDGQVDKWYIYRNRSGYLDTDLADADQDFFYVGEVTDGTATFDDNTPDANLNEAERMQFNQNIPPTCKYGAIYGERLFHAGFDPLALTVTDITGSVATVSSPHSGYSTNLPDGLVGCSFLVPTLVNPIAYTITAVSGLTLTLDSVTGLTAGAQSTAVIIARNGYQIYFSEHGDPDAWGPNGEAFRNYRELPGRESCTGLVAFDGKLLVFTKNNIYAIYGQGTNASDVKISPEPLVAGIGALGQEAIFKIDREVIFVSQRGIFSLGEGGLRPIAPQLGNQWQIGFTAAQAAEICVGADADFIYVSFPGLGKVQNSRTWRIDRLTGTAWEERGGYTGFFTDMLATSEAESLLGGTQTLYGWFGRTIFEPNTTQLGTRADGLADNIAGLVSDVTTTTMTAGSSVFGINTIAGAYVDFYSSLTSHVLLFRRRIHTHTGTVLTWKSDSTVDGGGDLPLTLANYPTLFFRVGVTQWTWRSRSVEALAHAKMESELHVSFARMTPPLDVYPNLMLSSFAFDNANWTKTNVTVTADADQSPDGTVSADRIIETTAVNSKHMVEQAVTLTAEYHTFMVYARAGTKRKMYMEVLLPSTGILNIGFDLIDGTPFSLNAVGVVPYAYSIIPASYRFPASEQWWVCSMTFLATAASHTMRMGMFDLSDPPSKQYTGVTTNYISLVAATIDLGDWSHLFKRDYVDGSIVAAAAEASSISANQRGKHWDLRLADRDYSCLIASRDDAQVRSLVVQTEVQETDK